MLDRVNKDDYYISRMFPLNVRVRFNETFS